jgi:hypothetical protein
VLQEAGYTKQRIERLIASGAAGVPPSGDTS